MSAPRQEPATGSVVVRPNVAPEGWGDALLTLGAGVLVLLMALAAPAGAAAIVYARMHDGRMAFDVGLTLFALLGAVAALTSVGWLKVTAAGLRFGRRMGRPRFLPWADVVAIEPAPPREVVVRGWLWPPLPPREATRSLSSQGHYRIEYRGGSCYFPPVDAVAFRAAIRRFRPDLLARETGS